MVENRRVPSLPLISENESPVHTPWSFTTLSRGSFAARGESMGFTTSHTTLLQTPHAQLSSERGYYVSPPKLNEIVAQNPLKRPRGRPPGSKNKPKSLIVEREDTETIHKLILIEIPRGNDIVETLTRFAQHHDANITVLSGSGLVSDITLKNPMSFSSTFPMIGTFNMMSIFGTYLNANCGIVPPQTNPCSPFSIYISGDQGQVFGGIVVGKIMSVDSVLVTATLFRNHEFYKVDFVNGLINDIPINNYLTQVEGNSNDDNNNIAMSTFEVAGSSSGSLNRQLLPTTP